MTWLLFLLACFLFFSDATNGLPNSDPLAIGKQFHAVCAHRLALILLQLPRSGFVCLLSSLTGPPAASTLHLYPDHQSIIRAAAFLR